MTHGIFTTLSQSKARLIAQHDLGAGSLLAGWVNARDEVHYQAPRAHTVSLYINGGGESRRRGQAGTGWPGAICIFPEGSYSDWDISGPFRFAHLYFTPARFARFVAETLDRDPRSLALPDQSFLDSPALRAAMQALIAAEGPLARETAQSELFAALAAHCGRAAPVQGGLSPAIARRVTEHLRAHLDRPVTLRELAQEAGLSEFHLQRMFRAQFGTTPHGWQEARRIERAQSLIRAGEGLAAVAADCGFSSQSHLTRAFRRATGVTPGIWRRAAKKADFPARPA